MQSGSNRPGGDAEDVGDLVERQVEVVVQHHHRTMVDGEAPEAALELVAIDDRAQAFRHLRLVCREEADVRRPASRPASLGVAGAHEEPVRPGVKARRVAELRKVSPDAEQRLLRRILGEVGVAQDPVRHRVESVAGGNGEAREGLLVTVLRPSDQIGIHVSLPPYRRPTSPGVSYGMGRVERRVTHSLSGERRRVAVRDTRGMKLYFAGPLFTTPERQWNAEVTAALRAAGHEIFLPQEQEPGKDGPGIFATDVGGIDWADGLVAIMDGPDPDSGTCWEVGYAFRKKPIVLVRTDFRAMEGRAGEYNPMLTQAATIRLDLPAASTTEVVGAVLEALERIQAA